MPNFRDQWVNGVWKFTQERFAFIKLWSLDVAFDNPANERNRSIKAFRFHIGLAKFKEAEEQRETINTLRDIAGTVVYA